VTSFLATVALVIICILWYKNRAETQKRVRDMRLDGQNVKLCPRCSGDGYRGFWGTRVCDECGGSGIRIDKEHGDPDDAAW
jgi:hypothetical protein